MIEEAILKLVRTGNVEGFHSLQFNNDNFHIGVTSNNAIRQLKNNIIINTTLCTRAAIDSGLEYDTAYELSDHFIQLTEQTDNPDILYELLGKTSYTFAEKVAQAQTPFSTDERLQKAIQYIQQNINQHFFVFFKPEPLSDCLQKTVWYDAKQIQAQAVINRPAPDDVTMIGFDDLPIADSLYITFLILLLSAA